MLLIFIAVFPSAGFGSCCGFVTVLPVMLRNFKSKQHGGITGLLFSFFSVGPAVYAAIYGACFIDGHVIDAAKQDLSGYYLFSAVSCLVLYLLGILFINDIPRGDSSENQPSPPQDTDSLQGPGEATLLMSGERSTDVRTDTLKEDSSNTHTAELTGCALFCRSDFHLVLWPYILCSTVALTFFNNVSAFLKSFHHESFVTLCAVLSPIVGIVSNLSLGMASDYTAKKLPRVTYQLVVNIIQGVFLVLCIFFSGNVTVFIFTVVAVSISAGGAMTISPTILTEISGTRYFGRNIGGMIIGQGVGVFVLQIIVGVLYDANKNDNNDCYGQHCFLSSFLILTVLSVITLALQAVHLYVSIKQQNMTSR